MASTWRPTSMRTRRAASFFSSVAARDAERLEAFQRKLGVDHHAGLRSSAYATGSRDACRWRAWPGRCRRPLGNPSWMMVSMRIWPKAPRACLLARISCKRDHVGGELGQVLLRRCRSRRAAHAAWRSNSVRLARGLGEVGADPMGHAVEPLIDGAGKLAMAADADLGEASAAGLSARRAGLRSRRLAPAAGPYAPRRRPPARAAQAPRTRQPKQDQHGVERDSSPPG